MPLTGELDLEYSLEKFQEKGLINTKENTALQVLDELFKHNKILLISTSNSNARIVNINLFTYTKEGITRENNTLRIEGQDFSMGKIAVIYGRATEGPTYHIKLPIRTTRFFRQNAKSLKGIYVFNNRK